MPSIRIELPDDVREIVLDVQKEHKAKRKILLYSQQKTIYSIIREYKKLKEVMLCQTQNKS